MQYKYTYSINIFMKYQKPGRGKRRKGWKVGGKEGGRGKRRKGGKV